MFEVMSMKSEEWTAASANPQSTVRRVVEFWRQSFGEQKDSWPYTEKGDIHMIGIEHGCAVCYARIEKNNKVTQNTHVNDLCVSPRCRNRGIGGLFMEYIKSKYKTLSLDVDKHGKDFEYLVQWYKKFGFVVKMDIPCYCIMELKQ